MDRLTSTLAARVPLRLHAVASAQDDVLSRAQLTDHGVGSDVVIAQVRARRWRVVGLAVVLHRGPITRTQWHWVAVMQTRGRGALAAWSALEVAGLTGWTREQVHVVVARGWTVRRVPGLVVHESRRFDPERDVGRGPGPTRTPVARSAVDAAAWSSSARAAAGLLAAVAQQRLCTAAQLSSALVAAGRVRHVRLMRQAVADISGGAQSLAEIDMGALIRRAGLPEPRRQAVRRDASGRRRYIDLEVDLPDGVLLMVEVDGGHHLEVTQAWADQERQNDLVAPGRVLLRFTTFAIRHDQSGVVRQLRRILADHSPSPTRVVSDLTSHDSGIR